jgi:ubiquinone biosynthesis protein
LVIEDLGPTFIKLGQILSTRGDLLPDAYRMELAKLQDSAPPAPSRRCSPALTCSPSPPPPSARRTPRRSMMEQR